MFRALLARLVDQGNGSDDEAGDQAEETEFLPSRLDASVLFAYGMGTADAENEMAILEENTRMLENQHRDK